MKPYGSFAVALESAEEDRPVAETADARRSAPAAARNADPILEVLRRVLPPAARVLEVASGSGEHALHFARALPDRSFLPSDPDPDSLASAEAWRRHAGPPNLLPPIALDVHQTPWPLDASTAPDAIVCINMIHISPWSACLALLDGAARWLPPGAPLVLYGPYREGGVHTAPSNADFDAGLRARDPRWGVRDLEAVRDAAAERGFALEEVVVMPANNRSLVFRRG